jgi:hypothetical protein
MNIAGKSVTDFWIIACYHCKNLYLCLKTWNGCVGFVHCQLKHAWLLGCLLCWFSWNLNKSYANFIHLRITGHILGQLHSHMQLSFTEQLRQPVDGQFCWWVLIKLCTTYSCCNGRFQCMISEQRLDFLILRCHFPWLKCWHKWWQDSDNTI